MMLLNSVIALAFFILNGVLTLFFLDLSWAASAISFDSYLADCLVFALDLEKFLTNASISS